MKPFDLYQHFHKFCEMLGNEALSIETRQKMGEEWIKSLPARQLCVSYELSRDLIEREMKGRLDKELSYGRGIQKASEAAQVLQGQVPRESAERPSEKPVHSDAGNRGGKTSVETLDRPKVPKAKRQGARKA